MQTIPLTIARHHLDDLIRSVEQGTRVAITRRGKTVAILDPAPNRRRRGLPDLTAFRKNQRVKGSLSAAVIAERNTGR